MRTLNAIRKVVFYSSIAVIALWIILTIVGSCITLQLTGGYDSTYDAFQGIGIPVIILCTLSGTLRRTDGWVLILAKTVFTIALAIAAFFAIFSATFTFCRNDIDRFLFKNKESPSYRIARRSFGCGAVDSTPDNHAIYRVRHLAPHVYWIIEPIDTASIDRSKWERVNVLPASKAVGE